MICGISCSIAAIFLIAMLYMTVGPRLTSPNFMQKYMSTLTKGQMKIYKEIVNERSTIHLQGYALGLILSAVVIYYNRVVSKNKKLSQIPLICTVGAITFLTNYFYYILSPKSNWMILHLTSQVQKAEWLNVYRTMQWNYHAGFVLGIVAVMFFANGCK